MAGSGERTWVAKSFEKPDTALRVRVTEYDRSERFRRAATIFFPLLLGAALSLPVPAWHLFAVPGFLGAAVVLGLRRLRETSRIESVDGRCPACGEPQGFLVPARAVPPITVACPACGEFVTAQESPSGC